MNLRGKHGARLTDRIPLDRTGATPGSIFGLPRRASRFAYDLAWHAGRARVIIVVLLGLSLGLTIGPQAQDVLVGLGQGRAVLPWIAFFVSVIWLAINAWFWSRFALTVQLGAQNDPDHPSQHPSQHIAAIAHWLPRWLGLVPFVAVSLALLRAAHAVPPEMDAMTNVTASGAGPLLAGSAAAAVMGLLFVVLVVKLAPHDYILPAGERRVSRGAAIMVGVTLLTAVAGMVAFGLDPVTTGRAIQPGPTMLLAAAGLVCGGTIVTWYGTMTRIPILAVLLTLSLVLGLLRDSDIVPDNHDIRTTGTPLRARLDLVTAFETFVHARAAAYAVAEPAPVVLVATSGGGLAAAFWTSTVLGDLIDHVPGFGEQLFAISGVSGGSLGAVETIGMLRSAGHEARCGGLRQCTQKTLGADFLAPPLGSFLYSDALQRFLPFPIFADRAAALEHAWEARWHAVTGNDVMAGSFLDLWAPDHPWPALLLNGTSVLTGARIITSNLVLHNATPAQSVAAEDVLAAMDAEVPASTAVDNSARFPYFGPVGVLRQHALGNTHGRVVDLVADGGYFENFGATTLIDVLAALAETAQRDKLAVRFVVIQIIGAPPSVREMTPVSMAPRGIMAPLAALLRTRTARGEDATEALARQTALLGGTYIPIRLGFSPTGRTAPLSWSLSEVARQVIDAQWTQPCRNHVAAEMALLSRAAPPAARDASAMLHERACEPEGFTGRVPG
jgi:hypothetical protein